MHIAAGGGNGNQGAGSGGGGKGRGNDWRDGTVVAALVPAVAAGLVVTSTQAAKMSFRRRVAGLSLRDMVRSSDIRSELGVEPLLLCTKRSQLRLLLEVFHARPTGWTSQG